MSFRLKAPMSRSKMLLRGVILSGLVLVIQWIPRGSFGNVVAAPLLNGPVLFEDDFNDGNADGWEILGAGSWSVVNNEFVVAMGQGTQLRGFAIAGDPGWSNFVYDVDIRGGTGVDKMIVARYVNPDTWYALNLRSYPFDDLSLSRENDGLHTIMVSVPFENEVGTWHHLTWEFNNTRIKVYVDQELLINCEYCGASINSGRIGLLGYTGEWDIDQVAYDNVRVQNSNPTDVELTSVKGDPSQPWQVLVLIPVLFLLVRVVMTWSDKRGAKQEQ